MYNEQTNARLIDSLLYRSLTSLEKHHQDSMLLSRHGIRVP
jgi:hypothetical protein